MPDSAPSAAPSNILHPPDWSAVATEIVCPLCEYNLRGLTEPRCPECGYQFQWADLLDPSRREHPYLFELRRKRKFKAFWKTAWHGLRPRKFWNSLCAHHRIVPGRLITYWCIVASVVIAAFASDYFVEVLREYLDYRSNVLVFPSPNRGPVPTFLWPGARAQDVLIGPALVLIWPWLTLASLSIFQISMRRAKLKQAHILRCIVYGADVLFWIALGALILNGARALRILLSEHRASTSWASVLGMFYRRQLTYDYDPTGQAAIFWVVWMVFVYRLTTAYWYYLKFKHVVPTVISSQIITGLSALVVLWLFHENGIIQ